MTPNRYFAIIVANDFVNVKLKKNFWQNQISKFFNFWESYNKALHCEVYVS